MERITVKISPEGEIDVEVTGVKGKRCRDVTEFIEKLGKTKSVQRTTDYYMSDPRERHTTKN